MMPSASSYSRERYTSQSGQQRAIPVSEQRYQQARNVKPLSPSALAIPGAIAAVLLVIIIVRFVAFGGTASQYADVKSQIDRNEAQVAQLVDESAQFQGQIDDMQPEIEIYNASGKK